MTSWISLFGSFSISADNSALAEIQAMIWTFVHCDEFFQPIG